MVKEVDTVAVGYRIREVRQKLGLSMDAFAAKIDDKAKSGTVSNWETGKNLPNNKRLQRIAELGGIKLAYLLSGNPYDNLNDEEKLQFEERELEQQKYDYNLQNFKKTRYAQLEDFYEGDNKLFVNGHQLTKEEFEKIFKLFENKEVNYPSEEEIEHEFKMIKERKEQTKLDINEGKYFFKFDKDSNIPTE